MKRFALFGVVGFVLASAAGCGGPDSLMKEIISQMNDLAASIEKKEPPEKQKAIEEKMKATTEKLNKLNLSDEQKKKLAEKHKADLEKAVQRLMAAKFGQMTEGLGAGGMPNVGDLFGPMMGGEGRPTRPGGNAPTNPEPAGKPGGDK